MPHPPSDRTECDWYVIENRLKTAIQERDAEKIYAVSQEIHGVEARGWEVPRKIDRLWQRATDLVLELEKR